MIYYLYKYFFAIERERERLISLVLKVLCCHGCCTIWLRCPRYCCVCVVVQWGGVCVCVFRWKKRGPIIKTVSTPYTSSRSMQCNTRNFIKPNSSKQEFHINTGSSSAGESTHQHLLHQFLTILAAELHLSSISMHSDGMSLISCKLEAA